jgi:DNA-binding XRE family transcriptional regulator
MERSLSDKIKAIRMAGGYTQAEFADKLGTTQSTVTRWESGSAPRKDMLQAIAALANTTVDRLLDLDDPAIQADQIPVVGYVGGGAEVFPFDDYSHGDGMDVVDRPPFIEGKAVAVQVRGDSLFPVAENGWRLVYAGEQGLIEEDVLGKLCVVKIVDGPTLVKRLMRGSIPGHYHLMSTNAPAIEDAQVEWAARVKAIIPT